MQAIIADTTPLNYLVLIKAVEILPKLYGGVLIPPAVKAELAHSNTPEPVRAWVAQPPSWLQVQSPQRPIAPSLSHLDVGQRKAISLASELQTALLLMTVRAKVASSTPVAPTNFPVQRNLSRGQTHPSCRGLT